MKRTIILLLLSLFLMATANAQTVVYYHTDALGTPIAVTDASGDVVERSEYEPYGSLLNRPLTDGPGYTGHVMDAATGLTYMEQRYYDQISGRFLSVDPIAVDPGNGTKFNRYAYALNNPYKFTDPDGRDEEWFSNVDQMGNPGFGNELGDDAFNTSGKALLSAASGGATVPGLLRAVAAPFIKDSVREIVVSADRHPESAAHIRDAQAAGQPKVLTINRKGAAANRREALRGTSTQSGKDRDEYPPAMFEEGGGGASVRHIGSSDNRGAGACIGAQCKGLPDGAKIRLRVIEKKNEH